MTVLASLLAGMLHVVSSQAATLVPLTQYRNYPVSQIGKIEVDFVITTNRCTGTVLTSNNQSVVETAAHCLYDSQGTLAPARDVEFCPQYHNGESPLGCWRGRNLLLSPYFQYTNNPTISNSQYDYAFVVVSPQAATATLPARTLQNVLGGAPYLIDQARRQPQVTVYGYPTTSGAREYMYSVSGKAIDVSRTTSSMKIMQMNNFDMTGGGASGGPWFATVNNTMYLIGNLSVVIGTSSRGYSPSFDSRWQALFEEAELS
jgi:V8-like Glu-specific endopeptidase